ncbi:LANO_0F14752g1_1 [Lachancea nothofagi CBS 11611]|uniref:LANO_0F14752g1_1 n=1 Tax=Lachancea nothofagi CBS 11611 TaxID=1266666 RepID=A0A1G4KCE8_9SACH|nr:LANO_0F14752g1_1 [Lachancea nothofagi CBS 11611]
MLSYAIFTIVAILWLVYRLALFLGIPVWRIVSTLGLQVPQTTRVSIDEITEETITVRWENEPTNATEKESASISRYILYLNNVKIGSIPNIPTSLYTCCSLKNLLPQTQYQFDFVCVNKDGFMNKVPAIYVMTKPKSPKKHDSQISAEEVDTNLLVASNFPADTKWRKSQVAVSTESPTSYASLTSLQDLDDFSITDLKCILVCAQEDLHDVLQQEASILQDFHESEVQLRLELDNLKAQWAHEIDLRKSLKSSIKSLENSKLLYDLKRGKLDKNIDQSVNKIKKMKTDMIKWDQERKNHLRQENLQEKFNNEKKSLLERIDEVSKQVKELHSRVASQEEENKRLNSVKKSLDSTQSALPTSASASANTSKRNSPVENGNSGLNMNFIAKRINECTNEKTGILNNVGQEFLNSLGENSAVCALLKDEIKKDLNSENQWRARKLKMKKRNELMESLWSEISMKNRELMAGLAAQPYTSARQAPSPNGSAPALALHDPSTYVSADTMHEQSAFGNESFRHASPPPNTTQAYTNWNIHQPNGQQIEAGGEDQQFDYDNAHHLLSGLQNMISEEDYQATNVSTSKLYTTDELDNYWSRQTAPEMIPHRAQEHYSTQPSNLPLLSPTSILENPDNSHHMRIMSNESFAPVSVSQDEDLSMFAHTPIVQRDDVISFGSGYNNDPALRTSPLPLPMTEDFTKDNLFGSGHFNAIWNNSHTGETPSSPVVEKLGTPKSQHTRSNSRGSWSLPHFMQKSPNGKSESKNNSGGSSNGEAKDRESHGGERRMSKLLTKSGMNHLFRSPTHDN